MSRIAVLGAGSWGTALAMSLSRRGGHAITLWAHSRERAAALAQSRINETYLPGFPLPRDVFVTAGLEEATAAADIVLFVVPSQHMRGVISQLAPHLSPQQTLLSASKGLEETTLLRMSQILREFAPANAVGSLTGPSFAQGVAAGLPTALVVGCEVPSTSDSEELSTSLQEAFTSSSLRVYRNDDLPGIELGGALKNVIALASGLADGLGLGANANAALITRGIAETTRLSIECGGKSETLLGLAGVGDLMLTCNGSFSRNRAVGVALGRGERLAAVLAGMQGKVAEGINCSSAALGLAQRNGVEMPITEQVEAILHRGKAPSEAMRALMDRPGKAE